MCNKGHRFSVTLLIPQGSPRQVSLRTLCHAPPCANHGLCAGLPEGQEARGLEHLSPQFASPTLRSTPRVQGKFADILQVEIR
jgi:hypothetical protein